jgi:hypothetical protein
VPVDTRALVALSDLAAHVRPVGTAPSAAPAAVVARRRVGGLAVASVAAGLVCGLVVPVDTATTAAAVPASHRVSAAAAPAVLLVGTPSPFAAVPARRAPATKPSATPSVTPAAKQAVTPATKPVTPATKPATAAKPAAVATKPRVASRTGTVLAPVADPLPARAGSAVALRRVAPTGTTAAGAPAYVPTRALPAHSGTGRRIVYSERAAHLWVVGADGVVVRDYPVTGRVGRPKPGVYRVYSKSTVAINLGEKLRFEYMVRFAVGITGARIGFHTIPRYYDGVPIQRESQLGRAIGAGGCVRQSRADAVWLYRWSHVGDTVVVRL